VGLKVHGGNLEERTIPAHHVEKGLSNRAKATYCKETFLAVLSETRLMDKKRDRS